MPVDLKQLHSRKLNATDLNKEARYLADQFLDDTTKQPIRVGDGVSVGGFNTDIDARNFLSRHLRPALDILEKECGWGKNSRTKTGKRAATVKTHPPRPDEEDPTKFEIWIERIRE